MQDSQKNSKLRGMQMSFCSVWGKFLDIYKCHFGEGDSRNIKLYLFVEAGFSSICQGSVSGLNEDHWSFHCSITWPVAASLEGLEGLRAPQSPFIMGNRGQIPGWCGHEQREVDACSSGSWIPALVRLQAVCQQFISRTLTVNIFLIFFFFTLMVTTQHSPSHPNWLQENREYFSKLLSCNKCTQQMSCEFSQNKKRLSCL